MIKIVLLDNSECYINPDLIERIENKVFTTNIILTTEKTIITEEKAERIVDKIIEYRKQIFVNLPEVINYEENI